jgi:hypothetical protein
MLIKYASLKCHVFQYNINNSYLVHIRINPTIFRDKKIGKFQHFIIEELEILTNTCNYHIQWPLCQSTLTFYNIAHQ